MASLVIPYKFVPGQIALASEMNENFQKIEEWASGNLGTANITTLQARPGGGSILQFDQIANFPVIDVLNNGADSSLKIVQNVELQPGRAVIDILDNNAHDNEDTAQMRMTLNGETDIPAILITHGGNTTFQVSRTEITLGADLVTDDDIICSGKIITKRAAVEYEINPQLFSAGILNTNAPKEINWNNGPIQELTLNTNTTVTLTFTNGVLGGTYLLKIIRGGVLNGQLSWPLSVKWSLTGPPNLSSSSNKVDLISFIYDGITYYGTYSLGY